MLSWQEYCKEIADYLIEKYKPTKLEILKVASNGGWGFWAFSDDAKFPYRITKKQILKYDSLGGNREDFLSTIYRYFLLNLFPEFNKNEDFIVLYARDKEFWQLNLTYYTHTQKTIFEDYALPEFDWDAWGVERRIQLLRAYDEKIMRIATIS